MAATSAACVASGGAFSASVEVPVVPAASVASLAVADAACATA